MNILHGMGVCKLSRKIHSGFKLHQYSEVGNSELGCNLSYSQYVNKQYGESVCSHFPKKICTEQETNVNIIEQPVSVL